jgi:hypothetical protein
MNLQIKCPTMPIQVYLPQMPNLADFIPKFNNAQSRAMEDAL